MAVMVSGGESSSDDRDSTITPPPVLQKDATLNRPRRSVAKAQIVECAVETCESTDKTMNEHGKNVQFFDLPEKKNLCASWLKAIPELMYLEASCKRKVCELHFVDGAPSADHPIPTLLLSIENDVTPAKEDKSNSLDPSPPKRMKIDVLQGEKGVEEGVVVLGDTPSPQPIEEEKPKRRNFLDLLVNNQNEPISLPTAPSNGNNAARVVKLRSLGGGMKPEEGVSFGRTADGRILKIRRVLKSSLTSGSLNAIASTSQLGNPKVGFASRAGRIPDGRVIPQSVNKAASTLAELSSKSEGSGNTAEPLTLFSALEKVRQLPVPSSNSPVAANSAQKCGGEDKCLEEACPNCIASLPMLRRTIGRLESQMEMMTNMVRTIYQHIQASQSGGGQQAVQQVVRPVAPPQRLLSGAMSAVSRTPVATNNRPFPAKSGFTFTTVGDYKNSLSSGAGKIGYSIANPTASGMKSVADKKTMARCVLLYPGNTFNIDELMEAYPNVSRKFHMKMFEALLREMTNNGCVIRTDGDDDLPYADRDATYAKETNIVKILPQLEMYGIPLSQYVKSLSDS